MNLPVAQKCITDGYNKQQSRTSRRKIVTTASTPKIIRNSYDSFRYPWKNRIQKDTSKSLKQNSKGQTESQQKRRSTSQRLKLEELNDEGWNNSTTKIACTKITQCPSRCPEWTHLRIHRKKMHNVSDYAHCKSKNPRA